MDRADENGHLAGAEVTSPIRGGAFHVGGAQAEERSTGGEPASAISETPVPLPDRPRMGRRSQARVLLAIRDLGFHQEVLDFLERESRVTVVGAVSQPDALFRMANTSKPDVTVVCPVTARDVRHPAANGRAPNLLVVAEEMTVPVLREAIEAGARGVFAWPEEREELARTILAIPRADEPRPSGRGRVIAVFGPRGGSGTTFIATHLAAALAEEGQRCVLIDLDVGFADLTVALGMGADTDARTVADLVPVAEELSSEHVEDALHHHSRGFSALLAPTEVSAGSSIVPGLYEGVINQLALSNEFVVLHLPRSLEENARMALSLADEVVLLVAPDLFSLHASRRAVEAFGLAEPPGRCLVVVNPLVRGGIGAADVGESLGIPASVAIRFDPAVGRFQDRGELLPPRSRGAGRDLRALAKLLMAGEAAGSHR